MKMKTLFITVMVGSLCLCGGYLSAQEKERVTNTGDWFEIKQDAHLVAGKPFQFEIKLNDVEPGMQLVCGLHWYKGKKYGGVVKTFARQKDVEKGKWYKFTPVFKKLPAEATSYKIIFFNSPTGKWEDRVNKGDSNKITLLPAQEKAQEKELVTRTEENEWVTKTGDWFEIKQDAHLVAGKPFHFEIKLKDIEPGMTLVCGLHWYDRKKYGGLVKVFAKQKDLENGKWYTFTPVFEEFPAEATFYRIPFYISPTGRWEDRVNKDGSKNITLKK